MSSAKPASPLSIVGAILTILLAACSVSGEGLRGLSDGSAGGATGTTWCPSGLTDQAGWPANTSYSSCQRTCGPDGIGTQTCSQTDRTTCLGKSGCVCVEGPCTTCQDCSFGSLPDGSLLDCYLPTNAATASLCADGVVRNGACAPSCDKRLCLQKDGKTACLCNSHGRYACGDWSGSSWE